MARKALSRKTVRELAPIVVPLVTRVAIPLAAKTLSRSRRDAEDAYAEAKERFGRNAKKTRSDLEDVREEALARGRKVYDEARKQGTELLDLLAARGAEMAQDWAESIGIPKRKRRFGFGKLLLLVTVVGVGVYAVTRR